MEWLTDCLNTYQRHTIHLCERMWFYTWTSSLILLNNLKQYVLSWFEQHNTTINNEFSYNIQQDLLAYTHPVKDCIYILGPSVQEYVAICSLKISDTEEVYIDNTDIEPFFNKFKPSDIQKGFNLTLSDVFEYLQQLTKNDGEMRYPNITEDSKLYMLFTNGAEYTFDDPDALFVYPEEILESFNIYSKEPKERDTLYCMED